MKKQYNIQAWKGTSDGHGQLDTFEKNVTTKKEKKQIIKKLKKRNYENIQITETMFLNASK